MSIELQMAQITLRRLRRHVRFIFEALLVLLLFSGLWLAVAGQDTYFEFLHYGLRSSSAIRLYLLLAIGFIFLVVVYYGTSFEVTPLTLISRPISKFARIRELEALSTKARLSRLNSVEEKDTDLDTAPVLEISDDAETLDEYPGDLQTTDTVERVLRRSSHSASHLARKMERRINAHLILGVLIGLIGLVVWYYSFFITPGSGNRSSGSTNASANATPTPEHPERTGGAVAVAWDLLPRVTILLFIELLAGFFLRQYRIGVEDFKYFLELQRRAEASRVAYAIFDQLGDSESKRKFATTLLEARSDIRLQKDETTTILEAMKSEENATLKLVTILGDHLESVTKLLRKDKEKEK